MYYPKIERRNNMKDYKFKFSVIVPIYKVEEYLAETLDSVINQTMDFKKNIQIILVNDGSPDNSEKICLKYVEKYPNNIKYVYQKNAGVSAARNNGLNYVEGKYVNFLDSDDKWEKDVFEKAWKMFEENNDIDIIGVRQKFFEASNGYPSLDHKFDRDKVVDINEDYDHIQLSVTSGFFRTEAIGDVRYDTRIKYSEDAKFINEIIIKKCKLGIIASSLHLYRKRASENSAIQTKNFKDDWYLITTELCYRHAFELSKKAFGKIIPYMQYYVAYDYQWRMKESIPTCISEEVREEYKKTTKELFAEIDDQIIFSQTRLPADYKIEYLKFKYGNGIVDEITYRKKRNSLFYKDLYAYNLEKNKFITLNITEFCEDKLILRGLVNLNLPTEIYKINLVLNNKNRKTLELLETNFKPKKMFDYEFMYAKAFETEIKLNNISSIYFEFEFKDGSRTKVDFNDGIDSKISTKSRVYYKHNKLLFTYRNKEIIVKKSTIKNNIYCFLRNMKFNISKKQFGVILYRGLYHMLKMFKHKELWLISDRPNTANDNGYAFYKYLQTKDNKKTKNYFVITKESNDFDKVKNTGKYVIYNSFKYKLMFLLADKIISSQADDWTTNPYEWKIRYYKDLINNKFFFLQHGIIKDDLSTWLNHYDKKIDMFVTSAQDEYDSIIKGEYGYKEDIVKLTGLPRYDLLENKKQKKIVIMPTWRMDLSNKIDTKTGVRKYNNIFKNSEYFKFYNELINDKGLLDVLKKKKYKCSFVLHNGHSANKEDFKTNKYIQIVDGSINYSDLFSENSLLITDYSSVAFDFAYLNKPVIYTQFDREKFFANQIYKEGYFDYEKNGFGPVLYDYKNTIKEIIKYIENDCTLESKYEKRIKKFYKYTDKNNCERVYQEIIKK